MRLLRFIYVPLFLLPLLLAGAWHWRSSLIESAAMFSLQLAGIEATALDIGEISASHSRIDRLILIDKTNNWQIDSSGLDFDYRLEELLQGRAQRISLESAIVTAGEKPPQPGRTGFDPLQGLALLRGSWRDRIPFQEARVGRLELRGDGFGTVNGEALAATLTRQESRIGARVDLLDRPDAPRALVVDSPDPNHMTVALRGDGETAPVAIDLLLEKDSVNAEATLDLGSIHQWLLPIAGKILPQSLRGTIQGVLGLKFEENDAYSLNLDVAAQPLHFAALSLEDFSAQISAHGSTRTPLTELTLEPGSRLRLKSLRYPSLQFATGDIALAGLMRRTQEGWHFVAEPENRSVFTTLSIDTMQADSLTIESDGEVMHTTGNTRIRLLPKFRAAIAGLDLGAAKIPNLSIGPSAETAIVIGGNEDIDESWNWSFERDKWLVDAGEIDVDGTLMHPSEFHLTLDKLRGKADQWELATKLDLNRLALKSDDLELPLQELSARLIGNSQRIELEGNLSPAGNSAELSFTLEHDLVGEKGSMKLSSPQNIKFSTPDQFLSKLVNNWTYNFDLVSGILNLELLATWSASAPVRLTAQTVLENGGGNFEEALFSGLQLEGEFELLPTLKTKGSATVKLESLDYGIMLHDITTSVILQTSANGPEPLLLAEQIEGGAYNARFSSRRIIYDLNSLEGNLNLTLDGIDLAHLVELAEMEDLTATGTLNGYIPVKIAASGVRVEQGRLWSRPPGGVLSYHAESEEATSESNSSITDYVFQALRDYRYHQLTAKMQYEPDGTMVLDLQLKGISPSIDPKRPVHLNVNLEQNLLTLLQSLRYSQGLSEELDNQVRKHFEHKTGLQ